MRTGRLFALCIAFLPVSLTPAQGQGFDTELGVVGGFGLEDPYQAGFGVTAGILAGRIYAGGRFVKHLGTTSTRMRTTSVVTSDSESFILSGELGVPLTLRPIEIRFNANIGIVRMSENVLTEPTDGSAATTTERRKTGSMFTPGITVLIPFPGFKVGGDFQFVNVGDPEFSEDFEARSFAFYGRVVIPLRQ